MSETSPNIHQRLLAVRLEVTNLGKDQQNERFKFSYVSSNNVLRVIRPLLDRERILLEVRILGHTLMPKWHPEQPTYKDQNEHLTELELEFVWVNVDNPKDTIVCPWYGQGLDTGEKGVGKALTYAEKYFLLKFFNIPTDEDDPDAKSTGDGAKQSEGRSAPPKEKTEPARPERLVTNTEECWSALQALGLKQTSYDRAKADAGMDEYDWENLDAEGLQKIVTAAKARISKARAKKTD